MSNLLHFSPTDSNHISRLSYDPDSTHLHVTFQNGMSYSFAGVPSTVFNAMTRSPSAGRYFHNVIKRHYRLVAKSTKEI